MPSSSPPRPFRLLDPVSAIRGAGPARVQAFSNAGVRTVFDLFCLQPRRYEDRTRTVPLSSTAAGTEKGVFRARLEKVKLTHLPGRRCIVWGSFSDSSGSMKARWFNQPYLVQTLVEGREYFLFGQVVPQTGGAFFLDGPEIETTADPLVPPRPDCLTPVYPSNRRLSEGRISPRVLRKFLAESLSKVDWMGSFPEIGPDTPFSKLRDALLSLHWPRTLEEAERARSFLAYFTQVLFQIGVLKRREHLCGVLMPTSVPPPETLPAPTDVHVPFPLTNDQKRVLGELLGDLFPPEAPGYRPMNRLLQGDVGCGKTIVAFLAMLEFSKTSPGAQCAFMAPTELLARQQEEVFLRLFPHLGHETCLLCGSTPPVERRSIHEGVAHGRARFLFGTHALFQDQVRFANLGFCVIDEQQRFGVVHRRALTEKSAPGNPPHLLMLSATPIPRTLSLTVFGDMETSIIEELPPGRQKISTHLIRRWQDSLPTLEDALSRGEQAFYVCPLISDSKKISCASVMEATERLASALPGRKIAAITGSHPEKEKAETWEGFRNGSIDLVVATSLIEVGVDNVNSTVMIVENAERFGLSQLHQLRGRIGRGKRPSTCFFISEKAGELERLEILAQTTDGFRIAVEDLRMRGPGDLVGTRQSGLSHPCFSFSFTAPMVEKSRARALELMTEAPSSTRDWFLDRMRESFGDSLGNFMDGG